MSRQIDANTIWLYIHDCSRPLKRTHTQLVSFTQDFAILFQISKEQGKFSFLLTNQSGLQGKQTQGNQHFIYAHVVQVKYH